jgi:hypothetical protein
MQLGIQCLTRAADAGHKVAAYVLAVLHYCYWDKQEAERYIRQVEGEGGVDHGCKQASGRTNRECVRCCAHAVHVVGDVTWKVAATMVPVPVPPAEDGQGCKGSGCGVPEGWADGYAVFCSEACRIRHEYSKFVSRVSLPATY